MDRSQFKKRRFNLPQIQAGGCTVCGEKARTHGAMIYDGTTLFEYDACEAHENYYQDMQTTIAKLDESTRKLLVADFVMAEIAFESSISMTHQAIEIAEFLLMQERYKDFADRVASAVIPPDL
jgi:hypothetical protein